MNFPTLSTEYYYFLYGIGAGILITVLVTLLLTIVYRLFSGIGARRQEIKEARMQKLAEERKKKAAEAIKEIEDSLKTPSTPPEPPVKKPVATTNQSPPAAVSKKDVPVVTINRKK